MIFFSLRPNVIQMVFYKKRQFLVVLFHLQLPSLLLSAETTQEVSMKFIQGKQPVIQFSINFYGISLLPGIIRLYRFVGSRI